MLGRDEWLDLARKLDWTFSYVSERDVYPEAVSGAPWLEHEAWRDWDEPYRTSFSEYASGQPRYCANTRISASVASSAAR